MRVVISYDHRGRKGAECVKTVIEQQGYECIDLGSKKDGVVDCTDFAYIAAMSVVQRKADTAILLCTTGVGMSMSANKIKGIRAARCCDEIDARNARQQFDANVLCISGEMLTDNVLRSIVQAWLNTDFADQRRSNRLVSKIRLIEKGRDPQQFDDTDDSSR